ncbi:MAG: cyclic nucleotide-binding domain-containing protein, partial [Anaerolineae bacterium]|nr:cyclic nucleotide-binding domain-containing protein [Anaerolineae bacterium]
MAIPYSNLLSFLKQHPLFKQFEEKELVEIIQHLEQILVQPGEDILLQDQLSDRYYVIYSGKVKMRRSQRRMPPAETVLVSGDRFGEETLIFNRPSTVTITAEEESTLLAFSFANFEWLIQTFPEIKEGIQPVTLPPAVQNPQFSWQRPGESVHLAARRHIAILFYDLLKPIGVLGFSLLILFVIGAIPGFTTVSLIL